jgi:hypothetical protein
MRLLAATIVAIVPDSRIPLPMQMKRKERKKRRRKVDGKNKV